MHYNDKCMFCFDRLDDYIYIWTTFYKNVLLFTLRQYSLMLSLKICISWHTGEIISKYYWPSKDIHYMPLFYFSLGNDFNKSLQLFLIITWICCRDCFFFLQKITPHCLINCDHSKLWVSTILKLRDVKIKMKSFNCCYFQKYNFNDYIPKLFQCYGQPVTVINSILYICISLYLYSNLMWTELEKNANSTFLFEFYIMVQNQ